MSCNEHVAHDQEHTFYLSLNHKDFRVVTITNLISPDLDTLYQASPLPRLIPEALCYVPTLKKSLKYISMVKQMHTAHH